MHFSPLAPVFTALRLALHAMAAVLAVVVAVRAVSSGGTTSVAAVTLAALWLAIYASGMVLVRSSRAGWWWLAALSLVWLGCLSASDDAVYLVFVMFFLYLHLAGMRWGTTCVAVSTAAAVVGFGLHGGWSVAAAIGPVLGAAVAVVISAGYRRLFDEVRSRQRLIDELLATRAELAAEQQEVGRARERERLAGEIHDTVSQSLSSIQMLTYAAERRAGECSPELQTARTAAADALAETRRLIDALTPAPLDGRSLGAALQRVTDDAGGHGLRTRFVVDGEPFGLPMPIEAALVRVAQSAVGNVVQHAWARVLRVTLTYSTDEVHLDIVDDGVGFDPEATPGFGLTTMRRRVRELGGDLDVVSEPGHTSVAVGFRVEAGLR
ncbi:sensor histidine kinase [Gordonia polyisoprenivorans]|uniref:sensor histidine kinase n=1 Tax=Gordonia polyisoprenivorans TaxID=84595 RepID=UPI001AD75A16|nr:sensor histidine kinase [Gordonia polyisoprenivorans]QTI67205.1 sensor histidine kinase [Gordonia polyisoprenivorans]